MIIAKKTDALAYKGIHPRLDRAVFLLAGGNLQRIHNCPGHFLVCEEMLPQGFFCSNFHTAIDTNNYNEVLGGD